MLWLVVFAVCLFVDVVTVGLFGAWWVFCLRLVGCLVLFEWCCYITPYCCLLLFLRVCLLVCLLVVV